jgi:predicted flap endonuclease-1-like 5' DNA nuclease
MALLQKLKSLLGFDGSDSERGSAREVGVTVERERSTDEGSAVDDVGDERGAAEPPQSAAAGSDAAASTDTLTEPTGGPEEAAEPAEATGPEPEDAAPTAEKTPDETDAGSAIREAEPADDAATEDESAAESADAEDAADPDNELEAAEAEDADEPEPEGSGEPVDSIKGIGPAYADRLADADVETVAELAAADAAELAERTDISEKRIQGWIDRAEVR